MTCKSVRPLLPLFVEDEDDLSVRKANRVRRHLQSCLPCRGLCQELRESQQWLRASATPAVTGAALDELRRSVWRRLEREPRPAPLWLAIERAWAGLRRWASHPAVAGAAVMLVVLGSVTLTRVGGLGGSRLVGGDLVMDPTRPVGLEPRAEDDGAGEESDDPETILAQATPDELAEGTDATGEGEAIVESAAEKAMRIEIQTQDPNVRIIWFTPPAAAPAAEN
jgi:hypothetical protein